MNSKTKSEKKQKIYIILLIFILLLIIFSFFPITGDDWARYAYGDTDITFSRLFASIKNDWLHLNGRVIGNTMSKILISSDLLRTLSKTLIVFGIYLCILYFTDIKHQSGYLVLFLLMILMPKEMFREVYQWSAGFFNYAPPVLFILLYFVILKSSAENKTKHKTIQLLVTLILGILSCLFAEHITVYVTFMSILSVLYFRVVKHQWNTISIIYLIGVFIGDLIMFTSPVYLNVFSGSDSYRDVSHGLSGVIIKALGNFSIISDYIFGKYILISLLLAGILIYLNINNDEEHKYLKYINVFILSIVPFYFFVTNELLYDELKGNSIELAFVDIIMYALYLFTFIYTIVRFIKDPCTKNRIYFYLISIIVLILPLFIVSPIGPRLFYIVYIMLILVVIDLCNYLEIFARLNKDIYIFMLVIFVLLTSFLYIFIYQSIYDIENKRNTHILNSIENNEREILIPELPFSEYIHPANSDAKKIGYKFYINVPGDVSFSYIPVEEWLDKYD